MNQDKVVEMADRETLKRRYARINWNAHLVPLVREAVADFGRASEAKGQPLPQLALCRDAIDPGASVGDSSTEAGDALTIQFGVRPGGTDAPAPPGYSRPLVAAGKAALVFAQAPTGAVAVLLYSAETPAAEPSRIGDYSDPADLTRARVRRLLRSLFDMHNGNSQHPDKLAAMADRDARKRRYARINWHAHLVPVVREAVTNFGAPSAAKEQPLPQLALRSDAIDHGEIVGAAGAEVGDSLTVQFGVGPVATGNAALVFAQAPSGAVAVFLYPPGTHSGKPNRIGDYRDPAELTRSRVQRLLLSLGQLHASGAP